MKTIFTSVADANDLWDPKPGWLNTASYGLPPRPAWDALQSALNDWRVGETSWEIWDESTARSRAAFARLVGVSVEDVTIGSTVSQLLAPVAASLPPRTRVVVPDIEFTSNLFPWLVQEARGVEVCPVPVTEFVQAITRGADVVAFSLVQSATGCVAEYDDIVEAARAQDALVVVDASQACGWLPFFASKADGVVVSGYKWLMSPRGCALGYFAPSLRERMTPSAAGWYAGEDVFDSYYGPPLRLAQSARRFDVSPAWFSYVGMAPALELIERITLSVICEHNVGLANRLLVGLGQPPGNSAMVTVPVDDAERKLQRAGIRAAVRAGRVRASFHVYSTEDDVDCALDALQ